MLPSPPKAGPQRVKTIKQDFLATLDGGGRDIQAKDQANKIALPMANLIFKL